MSYPDTRDGARALLRRESDLPYVDAAKAEPDPQVRGCWLLAAPSWRALVYVGDHPLAPSWEVEDPR